ncbi:XRE family transcriptional regulator [Kitasatospora sp. GAS204B]|uniref:helix-turn-helix domain-containing protein n=1 Tax=unclassified Kitasatospora TaxID=2633591 RepID=UPI0024766A69|nr:XRE family transcriptional regulator [Kitasatospora sp. GAS204B]MDH6117372.1 transcriptional regulator with XRE-family HTH domain [Kitasatospora sp. GAS204B]
MRRSRPPAPTPVPFSPQAARAHRVGLGLTSEQLTGALAAHGVRLLPTHVLGWESGELHPTEEELIALARALWCPAVQLMGVAPATLRDFRVARELSQEQAATRIGIGLRSYADAELTGRWTGNEEQSAALAEALGLTLRDLVRVQGAEQELEQRLRQCVDGRWQAQSKAIGKLVPVPRETLGRVLAALQSERQATAGHWGAGSWGSSTPAAPAPQQPEQAPIDRFWTLLAAQDIGGLRV